MGYYLGLAKICDIENNKAGKIKNIILSVLIPMLLHGAYDYFLMSNSSLLFMAFVIFIVLLYIFSIKKVKHVASIDRKIINRDYHCHNCGTLVTGNYCTNCGKKKE
jgi:RsiW-degrading membrane proteinase PrsW (M82 family)